ncbi:MAG: hypothetical protein RL323_2104 [Pseudomonadota bacterium]|jgi:1-acyl-sn-glycerol-3-phosphate acyltransferase
MHRPTVGVEVASWRLLRVLGELVRGLWVIRTQFGAWSEVRRQTEVQAWSRRVLGHMGVALDVRGEPAPQGPLLVVCNHLSWLDILVLNAVRPCRFVSKADVKKWPVVGMLAAGAGTVFIERERPRDAMRVVAHLAERLEAGEVLAVFPEGTTSDGSAVLPFHANLLQAAVVTCQPVQPMALAYRHAVTGHAHAAPLYVGQDTLVASLWRTLRARHLQAALHCEAPHTAAERERREWAAALHAQIGQMRAGLTVPAAPGH